MNKADKHFLERMRMRMWKAVQEFGLIAHGDRILVAVSGGKDSMALLDMLHNRRRMAGMEYDLAAAHIDLTDVPYHADDAVMRNFARARDIPYERITDDVRITEGGKHPCFYCAWNRRRLLFQRAVEHGFNKVALGHNRDDFTETMLMNMIYHGEISAFKPLQSMFEGKLEIIRPLFYLSNRQIERYVELIGYRPVPYNCPFAEGNDREKFRDLMRQIKKLHPKAGENLLRSARRIRKDYLPPTET